VGARLSFVDAEEAEEADSSSKVLAPSSLLQDKAVSDESSTVLDPLSEALGAALFCAPTGQEAPAPPPPPVPQMLPNMHGQRCACGCVPNILSLFEMAELRKQARLKQQS
jgi:hypothetical protein